MANYYDHNVMGSIEDVQVNLQVSSQQSANQNRVHNMSRCLILIITQNVGLIVTAVPLPDFPLLDFPQVWSISYEKCRRRIRFFLKPCMFQMLRSHLRYGSLQLPQKLVPTFNNHARLFPTLAKLLPQCANKNIASKNCYITIPSLACQAQSS